MSKLQFKRLFLCSSLSLLLSSAYTTSLLKEYCYFHLHRIVRNMRTPRYSQNWIKKLYAEIIQLQQMYFKSIFIRTISKLAYPQNTGSCVTPGMDLESIAMQKIGTFSIYLNFRFWLGTVMLGWLIRRIHWLDFGRKII